eukprot:190529-Chlamydomonas_euryale.AAC.5
MFFSRHRCQSRSCQQPCAGLVKLSSYVSRRQYPHPLLNLLLPKPLAWMFPLILGPLPHGVLHSCQPLYLACRGACMWPQERSQDARSNWEAALESKDRAISQLDEALASRQRAVEQLLAASDAGGRRPDALLHEKEMQVCHARARSQTQAGAHRYGAN